MGDLGTLITGSALLLAGAFAGLWGIQKYRNVKQERDQIKSVHDAIDSAAKRLEETRRQLEEKAPIDVKNRTDFE